MASDILQAAIERSHAANNDHATRVGSVCGTFADMIKRPWKSRVEAIGEAVATVRQIVGSDPAAEDSEPSKD